MPHLRAFLLLFMLLAPAWGARTYRIATTPWMGWVYLDVAQAKGYWKAEGVNVQVQSYPDGATYLDALLSRKADLSCGMVGDMVWIHTHAAPVNILLETNWSLGSDKFLVRRGKTLAELAGKPVGVYQHTYALPFFLRKALGPEFQHLARSPFVHLNPADMTAQVRAGRLDMAVLYDPFAQALEPLARVRATSSEPPGCIPEGLFGFRETVVAIPPADLEAILRGILKALDWVADSRNDEALLDIVNLGSFKSQPLKSVEEVRALKRGAPVHERTKLTTRNGKAGGLMSFLGEMQRFIKDFDPSAPAIKPSHLFNPDPIQRALVR